MGGPFKENLWGRGERKCHLVAQHWYLQKQCSIVALRNVLPSDKEGKCMIQPILVYSVAGLRSNGPIIDQLPVIRQHERGGGHSHQQYFCKGWCKLECVKTYLCVSIYI